MDTITLVDPSGDDLETSSSGGNKAEKGWVTLRLRRRCWLLSVAALIITGVVVISGFIMLAIAYSKLSRAVEQLHAVQNISLDDGVGVQQVCNTSECIYAANHLLLGMNQTADPCEDFYEYACGNWGQLSRDQGLTYNNHYKQIQISEDRIVNAILLRRPDSIEFQPAKMASIFYHQCLYEGEVYTQDNIKSIIALTAKLGGWPSLEGSDWNGNAFDLVTTLAYIFREHYLGIFFRMNLAPHGVNETINVIKLSVPSLISKDKLRNETYTTAFKSYYADTLCEVIGHTSSSRNCSSWESSLRQDADELIKLEKDLRLAATTIPYQHSDDANNQQIFTVEEFQKYLDEYVDHLEDNNMEWKGLLNQIFNTSGVEINDNQVLIVSNPEYFIRLAKILATTEKRIIANYLMYSLTFHQLWRASGKIYQLATEFYSDTGLLTRGDYCFSTTMAYFPIPVMHEYLKRKSNLEDRIVLEQIGENLRATFDKLLENNTWLANATKLAVRKKLKVLKFFIGYPNWLVNATEIEGRFEGLHVGSNLIETLANVIKRNRAEYLQTLGKSPQPLDEPWFRNNGLVGALVLFLKYDYTVPSDVGPYYSSSHNSVVIPMGFIQPHQIYNNVPSYVIYSWPGYVLGHEMVHGFDADRKNLDEKGQKDTSWTAEDELNYEEHSKCYKDQYNKFQVLPGMYLDGSFGLDENIADNDGLKLAYLTYKEQLNARGGAIDHQSLPGLETLSTEQMFFLSYSSMKCEYRNEESKRYHLRADPHSPGKFRVNGVLQNLPEFARAWNCSADAPMNPINKCTLW